jgi:hypothetical protein
MDFMWRALFFLLFGPLIFGIAVHVFLCFMITILPWILALAILTGVAVGVSAGFVIRWRRPRPGGTGRPPELPLGAHRVRRPRGVDQR